MPVTSMNHFTVLAEDLELTKAFYIDLMGLQEGPRPPLGFPGAWLYAGQTPVLHVVAGRQLPPDRRGVLDHMAFSAQNLASMARALREAGIDFDLRKQPESGVWQLFLFDPNGARVELDFAADEAPPKH